MGERSEGIEGANGRGERRRRGAGGGGRRCCCRDADVGVVVQGHVRVERVR